MALRDLREAGVGGGEQAEDLREGLRVDVRAAVVGGDGDGEQSGAGQPVQLFAGQPTFGVPRGGSRTELGGQGGGHGERLGGVGDDVRGHRGRVGVGHLAQLATAR
ncbi:hypothetical protein SAMN04487983_103740 [Streptomyces sp. yr375]|nr:hypothetical protein SAMN04487983_103740 [Streptomyces sp. yr375]